MVEPIPLDPFIKKVPEASLAKSLITPKPTRIQIKKRIQKTGATLSTMFVVPKGYIFEMVYWNFSFVNDTQGFNNADFEAVTGGNRFIFKEVNLLAGGMFNESVSIASPMLFEEADEFKANLGTTGGSTQLNITFFGNLIPLGDRKLI